MTADTLETVELQTGEDPRFAVIWMHGLGADGHDFESIVPMLELEDEAVRFVFPHAPRIPVTINMGMVMRAWYDITDLDLRQRHDLAGVRKAAGLIRGLIDQEVDRGIPHERIVLAGFSQGGAMALHVGLRHAERLCGLIALSTYLIDGAALEEELADANRGIDILQIHGTADPMVEIARGEEARDRMRALGLNVQWGTYPMGHQVCIEEIHDVGAFLRRLMASGGMDDAR